MAQDMDMFTVAQTICSVLCCKCGILMLPNSANMCVKCLQTEFNITECLAKHVAITRCPECGRYLEPPRDWTIAQLESENLLKFCLNRLKGLNEVHLVHAEFIWTEPHSKKIKVKLRVQKEVLNGAILEQAHVVEYDVRGKMCESCSRFQANPDQWDAAVQLRQHVSHRRTFLYLEQLILKHDAAKHAIRIKQMNQGIDFFFNRQSHGKNFVEFLRKVSPVHVAEAKKLVSHDTKSNKPRFRYTFSVEISPICREDLICLPPKVAISLGNLGPLVICNKVSNNIYIFDPFTLRGSFLNANQYWASPFKALLSSRQLVEYIVLDVDIVSSEVNVGGLRYVLAYVQVARVSDFGRNDMIFTVKTHLGHLLAPGDYALGYDLYGANINDIELDKYKDLDLPHVVLIKKSYKEKREKLGKPRSWKLKSLNMEVGDAGKVRDNDEENSDYELFLRDLEEIPDLMLNLSLYPDGEIQPSKSASMTDGEHVSSSLVDEFDSLDIDDEEGDDDIMKD